MALRPGPVAGGILFPRPRGVSYWTDGEQSRVVFGTSTPSQERASSALGGANVWSIISADEDRAFVNFQYSMWSDTWRDKPKYHAPERFGVVHFSAATVGASNVETQTELTEETPE